MSWPEDADSDKRNPMTVELYLRQIIKDAQVSLLGELDLDSINPWANTNWSLSQLAEYVFSFPALKVSLTKDVNTRARREQNSDQTGSVQYPATIAVWTVSQAQRLETGQELWTTADLNPNQISALPYKFEDSIRALELETFEGKLSEQKRLALARFHAIIPSYAIEEFVRVLRKCEEQHMATIAVLDSIARTQTLAISVKGLFEARPDIAIDIIERAFRTLRTGEPSGLPPRISKVLLSQATKKSTVRGNLQDEFPVISFDESSSELYVKGHSGWELIDSEQQKISPFIIPPRNLHARHLKGSIAQILDLNDGYLILSRSLDVMTQRTHLPKDGAIIWSNSVLFDYSALATEPSVISGWPNWNFALLKPIDKLQITLADGIIRSLGRSREIVVLGQPIRNVITADEFPVYSESPKIAAGQNLTISSNLNQASWKSSGNEQILVTENGHFDLTLYAGLGRSKNLKGFLLPGFSISNIEFPLLEKEMRKLGLKYSSEFTGPTEATVGANLEVHPVKVVEISSTRFIPILIKIPKLEWSLLFDNNEPQRFSRFSKMSTKELKRIGRLVVQDCSTLDVKLRIEVADELVMKVSPRIREDSLLFDLRVLRDSSVEEETNLSLESSYGISKILSFSPIPAQVINKGVKINDLRKLAEGWISVGGMTQQEWDDYQEATRRHSREVMKAYRLRRERR